MLMCDPDIERAISGDAKDDIKDGIKSQIQETENQMVRIQSQIFELKEHLLALSIQRNVLKQLL